MKQALFPISADPFTYGHLNIIEKAVAICEEKCTIVILENYEKKASLPLAKRKELTEATLKAHFKASENPDIEKAFSKLQVKSWSGMLHDFILQEEVFNIIRGIRNPQDLVYERALRKGYEAQLASTTTISLQFIYLLCDETFQDTSSSLAKSILLHGGEITSFVPPLIKKCLEITQLQQYKIIVTGSIGSGKSTIIPLLIEQLKKQRWEAHHINMDEIVAQIYQALEAGELQTLAKKLITYFQLQNPLSKQVVRELIFNSPPLQAQKYLKFLEQTLAPYIKKNYRHQLRGKKGIIFIEAPQAAEYRLIHESNGQVLFVTCEVTERKRRLIKQRQLNVEEVEQRMKLSTSPDEKLKRIEAQLKNLQLGKIFTYDNTPVDNFTALTTLAQTLINEFQ